MSTWHKGPPPSVGWWPASSSRWTTPISWWDGKCWSYPAMPYLTATQAADYAKKKYPASATRVIEWQDRPKYWPARSRT